MAATTNNKFTDLQSFSSLLLNSQASLSAHSQPAMQVNDYNFCVHVRVSLLQLDPGYMYILYIQV